MFLLSIYIILMVFIYPFSFDLKHLFNVKGIGHSFYFVRSMALLWAEWWFHGCLVVDQYRLIKGDRIIIKEKRYGRFALQIFCVHNTGMPHYVLELCYRILNCLDSSHIIPWNSNGAQCFKCFRGWREQKKMHVYSLINIVLVIGKQWICSPFFVWQP